MNCVHELLITLTHSNFQKSIRYRLYNDFIQSIENSSLKSKARICLPEYLSVCDLDFQRTFSIAKESGHLILETSFWSHYTAKNSEKRFLHKTIFILKISFQLSRVLVTQRNKNNHFCEKSNAF